VPTAPAPDVWHGTRVVCTFGSCEATLPWQTAGTALRLEHVGWARFGDRAAHCNTTWARLLRGFKEMCERGGPSKERWQPRA
jgi:hypothetical protein